MERGRIVKAKGTARGKGHTCDKVGRVYGRGGSSSERCGKALTSDLCFQGDVNAAEEPECEEQETSNKKHAVTRKEK